MREVRGREERIVNGKKLDAGNEERKVTERGAREGTWNNQSCEGS